MNLSLFRCTIISFFCRELVSYTAFKKVRVTELHLSLEISIGQKTFDTSDLG